MLTSPPGAGKTAVARILAAQLRRGVHIESDLWFHTIVVGSIRRGCPKRTTRTRS